MCKYATDFLPERRRGIFSVPFLPWNFSEAYRKLELEFFAGGILQVVKKQIKSTSWISDMEHLFEVERALKPAIFFIVSGFGPYLKIS